MSGTRIALCVGVGAPPASSRFAALPDAGENARALRDTLHDVPQLRSQAGAAKALCDASRGEILLALRTLAASAGAEDRLLFYFCGHAQLLSIGGTLQPVMVPADIYDDDAADACIELQQVLELLAASPAREQLLLLDLQVGAADLEAFPSSLRLGDGQSLLWSARSAAQSDSTRTLLRCLRGQVPEAIDAEHRLSLHGLHSQLGEHSERSGVLSPKPPAVIARFDGPLLDPEGVALEALPIDRFAFRDEGPMAVREVLTQLTRWSYTQRYLEDKVNAALGEHLEDELGRKAAMLCERLALHHGEVDVEGASVTFPGGVYEVRYEAEAIKRGRRVDHLDLDASWLDRGAEIPAMLEALALQPTAMRFEPRRRLESQRLLSGLQARGWEITARSPQRVEAAARGFRLCVEANALTLEGFDAAALLAGRGEDLARATLSLLGG